MKLIRNQLGKLKFALGIKPAVERAAGGEIYLPPGVKAVVTITADFELAWSWRYTKAVKDSYHYAISKARIARTNVPAILRLSEEFAIPITWATVGHLFLESCRRGTKRAHEEIPPIAPYRGRYWDFAGDDWFEYDPCSNYLTAPEWYAPDLVRSILDSTVPHEIGCHTFSHIDCNEEVCPTEVFEAELRECKKAADRFGLQLKSFVHPGHRIGHLKELAAQGFTSYQTDPGNVLGWPRGDESGLWELKRTAEFEFRPEWSIGYHIKRYRTIIDRALRHGRVCNFWFHVSVDTRFVEAVLPSVFSYLRARREDGVQVYTVGKYVDYLNSVVGGEES